jgi:hypothetical protein
MNLLLDFLLNTVPTVFHQSQPFTSFSYNFLQSATWHTCKRVKWKVGIVSSSSTNPITYKKPKEATFAWMRKTHTGISYST